MNKWRASGLLMLVGIVVPQLVHAQTDEGYLRGLHIVLDKLYVDMMPLCKGLINVSRAIAGIGALLFICGKVWPHFANAEPIEVYPLLRPFALVICIAAFPAVLNVINGVMKPTVVATAAMIKNSDAAMKAMLDGKKKAILEDTRGIVGPSGTDHQWETTPDPGANNAVIAGGLANPLFGASLAFGLQNMFKRFIASVLELIYEAAALCINAIRTFNLIVLSILGPLVFGLSAFDGFQHILRAWLARYINIYLWLPIANIFGAMMTKIQENMITLYATQSSDPWFSDTNTGYLVFLVIAIMGFWTVPSIANYIMHAGTMGSLMQRVNIQSRSIVQPVIGAITGRFK